MDRSTISNGVVESVNYEKNRLQVAVQILGRSTPVEIGVSPRWRRLKTLPSGSREGVWTQEIDSWQRKYRATSNCRYLQGSANPSPPIGPALGQQGVNIMEFCKQFNAQTQKVEKGLADSGDHHRVTATAASPS